MRLNWFSEKFLVYTLVRAEQGSESDSKYISYPCVCEGNNLDEIIKCYKMLMFENYKIYLDNDKEFYKSNDKYFWRYPIIVKKIPHNLECDKSSEIVFNYNDY